MTATRVTLPPRQTPTVEIKETARGAVLQVWVTGSYGDCHLSLSVPAGSLAAYPEAIAEGRARADRIMAEHIAHLCQFYPDLTVK